MTLAGWFLIHGHACFLFFVPVVLAAVLATVVWRHGPRALLTAFLRARFWVPVAVISAVFAVPIVAGLTLHWPGDLGKYFSYTSSSRAGGHDLVQVVWYALWFWWRDGGTWTVALVPVVLYAAAIAAVGLLSHGAVRRFLAALLAVNVVSTVAFACYAERTGVRACVQNPAWTFMMTRQFICTPGQVAGGAPFWFNSPTAPRGTAVIATLKNSQVIRTTRAPAGPAQP